MRIETELRKPTEKEQALLNLLLEDAFPGRPELADLLSQVLVRTIDKDGSLEIQSQLEGKAPVIKRIPVEAEGKDVDNVVIHMLLHVADGRPVELEFYRDDAGAVKEMPSPSDFELIVLPTQEKRRNKAD